MLGGPVDEEERWLDALEKGELDDNGDLKKEIDESLLTARQVKKRCRTRVEFLSAYSKRLLILAFAVRHQDVFLKLLILTLRSLETVFTHQHQVVALLYWVYFFVPGACLI